MKAVGIIPVRLAATRFPGKPLARIHGMPMVGHCYHRTRLADGLGGVYVATCDEQIADYVRSIGGSVVMTATTHARATTRTAEAVEHIESQTGDAIDIVVMVQGDEPLILPQTISESVEPFSDPSVEIVNVMSRLRTYEEFVDRNNVKVVVNHNGDAMYYSREPIPSPWLEASDPHWYMQTGIIAFRRNVLLRFNAMAETRLERLESIDMNRVLETGGRIRMVLTESMTIGVDTSEELTEAEKVMAGDPTLSKYLPR